MPRVAALIVDFNNQDSASKLALELARGPRPGFELDVIHIDNGNSKHVVLTTEERNAGVRLIRNETNDGYAGGAVNALQKLNPGFYTYYWILNSDLGVDSECLSRLVALMEAHPRVGASGPRVMKTGTDKVWGARGVISPWLGTTAMTDWASSSALPKWSYIPGSSIFVRRTALEEVGGISVRYRLYFEETELCVKLQRAGWLLWVEPTAVAYHEVQSLKGSIPARHYAYYTTRNAFYFWRENFGIPWIVQLPRTLFLILRELVLPLRRAEKFSDVLDRLKYVLCGLLDSVEFLSHRFTKWEKRLFLGGGK